MTESIYYRLQKKGTGWTVEEIKRFGKITSLKFDESNIDASNLPQTLKDLKKIKGDHIVTVPYFLNLEAPAVWYQAMFICKDSEQKERLENWIKNHEHDSCGSFLWQYNWINEIPSDVVQKWAKE